MCCQSHLNLRIFGTYWTELTLKYLLFCVAETGKWAVRRKIWDHLEDNNLVNAPRPCHYRIPNFEVKSVLTIW